MLIPMAEWSDEEAAAFGETLARLRDTHGLSQESLAAELGVTRALVRPVGEPLDRTPAPAGVRHGTPFQAAPGHAL